METLYVCNRCGYHGPAEEFVIISEVELLQHHYCGFLGIYCKTHPDAQVAAQRAVRRHLRRVRERERGS